MLILVSTYISISLHILGRLTTTAARFVSFCLTQPYLLIFALVDVVAVVGTTSEVHGLDRVGWLVVRTARRSATWIIQAAAAATGTFGTLFSELHKLEPRDEIKVEENFTLTNEMRFKCDCLCVVFCWLCLCLSLYHLCFACSFAKMTCVVRDSVHLRTFPADAIFDMCHCLHRHTYDRKMEQQKMYIYRNYN